MLRLPAVSLLLLLTGLSATSRTIAAPLPDFSATYSVSRGAISVGSSRIALTREPHGGYHYESHSWPSPWTAWFTKRTRHETSSGQLDETGLHPDTYRYLHTDGDHERVAHLTFHRNAGEVINNVAGSRWTMAIPSDTHDKLSTQVAMMQALADGKQTFAFNVADGGKLKVFRFRVAGRETVKVPAGTFSTISVIRTRDDSKRETRVWCAPQLSWLPVRIRRHEDNDAVYTSELASYSKTLERGN